MAGVLVDGVQHPEAAVLRTAKARLPWSDAVAKALAAAGLRDYMASRRSATRKSPPPVALLVPEYRDAVERFGADAPLIIGSKSMLAGPVLAWAGRIAP